MKNLVIGIDGGTLEILQHFDMPFTHNLISKAIVKELHEDVWSRGWAEMYTGEHARETQAFYQLPYLDGTTRFHRNFGWKTAVKNPKIEPLWDVVDKKGVKSLFMNIPTTFPAPNLKNGSFVAGAGGGLNNLSSIPDGLCSDDETKAILNELSYIVDLRYLTSGITEMEVLFERLDEMMLKRAESFVTLALKQAPDFAFLAFRATTIIQYVAYSEIDYLMKHTSSDGSMSDEYEERPVHGYLKTHYQNLDKALRLIFEKLTPETFIITADHATVPFKKRANLNPLLARLGYQHSRKGGFALRKFATKVLPISFLKTISKKTPKAVKDATRGYNVNSSRAFANHDVPGIYINDERFNGPVKSSLDRKALVDGICSALNGDDEFREERMEASPYREEFPSARYNDDLPDIWITTPEGTFFDGMEPRFITINPNFASIATLDDVRHDVNSGQKGRKPLFLMSDALEADFDKLDRPDLTSVYHLVKCIFS